MFVGSKNLILHIQAQKSKTHNSFSTTDSVIPGLRKFAEPNRCSKSSMSLPSLPVHYWRGIFILDPQPPRDAVQSTAVQNML